jgi:hypothetical protein
MNMITIELDANIFEVIIVALARAPTTKTTPPLRTFVDGWSGVLHIDRPATPTAVSKSAPGGAVTGSSNDCP